MPEVKISYSINRKIGENIHNFRVDIIDYSDIKINSSSFSLIIPDNATLTEIESILNHGLNKVSNYINKKAKIR